MGYLATGVIVAVTILILLAVVYVQEAQESVRQVWKDLPDLHVELDQVLASGDVALAHGMVHGTATGRLYGAPATKRSFQASFFDYVRVEDGRIIERVQQADVRSASSGSTPCSCGFEYLRAASAVTTIGSCWGWKDRRVSEWVFFMHPPRDDFIATMTGAERSAFGAHADWLRKLLADGVLIVAGPCLGQVNTGIAIFEAPDENAARLVVADEPVTSGGYMRGDLRPYRLGLLRGRDR
jgi:uncharacterized protein YciI